ncbi:uncharacterized protein UTRI_05101_B [Ustilago trichophora]|uniref:DUF4604 domain-containing protein n=1 Tax=Ustilago trichophora TaxID=86804 RepID=A0A5C3EH97_9BASI|nr:uncharacterized protein UTRI_05101_B [Ustilago trichophora]
MSGRKGNLASRSLEYRAPEVPSFLKALKAQVACSERYSSSSSSSSQRGGDELESFVKLTSSGKRKALDDEDDQDAGLDSEDEMNGAQVVVLKDGKHLSHTEALQLKTTSPALPRNSAGEKPQNIAASASATPSKRRRPPIQPHLTLDSIINTPTSTKPKVETAKSSLEDVKQLIRQDRQARSPPTSSTKQDKKEKTQDKRKVKNAQAKKLKAKSGKGLSFDLDD